MNILVDSNVLLDVLTEDPVWSVWSAGELELRTEQDVLWINPIVYAEVSVRFETIDELEEALPAAYLRRAPLPWEAGFLAGKCFVQYRKRGGTKQSPLPDFYIGAHAAVAGMVLLTRDAARYQTYFPTLQLICP